MSPTYRAWTISEIHQPWILANKDFPELLPGQARIRIQAAALNHRDIWIRQGMYAGIKLPCVPGSDGIGIVEAVGSIAESFWVGEQVIMNPSLDWGESERAPVSSFRILGMPDEGTFAEYVHLPVLQLMRPPAHLTLEEAAALPLAGLTAHRALFRRGELKAKEKVLITGIGGGAAQWLLQFAVAAEAEVWVTSSSTDKIETAKKWGATGGVLYTDPKWAEKLAEMAGTFDLCVDSAGGSGWTGICDLLKPGGKLVFFGVTNGIPKEIPLRKAFFKQLSFLGTTMGSPRDFSEMLQFVEAKKIRPILDSVWPFEKMMESVIRMEQGSQSGKIVVKMDSK